MGSKTVTTKTELPPMSPEEASMMNLGMNYLLAGPISEQFYIKSEEKTRYKNQTLYDQLASEKTTLENELRALEGRAESYRSAAPGTPAYATGMEKMREVESRIGTINARLGKLDSEIQKQSEGATTYMDYQLLSKPPPGMRKILLGLDDKTRDRAYNILENYGYTSSQFRNFAKTVSVPQM